MTQPATESYPSRAMIKKPGDQPKRPRYVFENVHIEGFDKGIVARGGLDIEARNLSFYRVNTPFDLDITGPVEPNGTRISNDPKLSDERSSATSGWTKPATPPLPARCPSCRSIFPSRNYYFNASRLNVKNKTEACPVCRYPEAAVADGLFRCMDGIIKFLSGPDVSQMTLLSIAQASGDYLSGRSDYRITTKIYKKISPTFAEWITRSRKWGAPAVAVLIFAANTASLMYTIQSNPVSQNQLDLAKQQYVQDADPEKISENQAKMQLAVMESILRKLQAMRFIASD